MSMHQIDLSRADLNLLVVFEVLMEERHVGRAAKRLCLSQSATSHALGRLRGMFNDPLFVRNPRGIEPTPRSRELSQSISDTLTQIRGFLNPVAAFDPAKLQRTFRIATHDYAIAVLVAPLMASLRTEAPGVDLRCINIHPEKVLEELDRGTVDCALGGLHGLKAERVTRSVVFADRFVGVARRDHPRLGNGTMTLDDFVDTPQVLISPGGEARGDIDEALKLLGRERRISITVPNFLTLPLIVQSTDLIGVLPERLAGQIAGAGSLMIFDLPLKIEPIISSMLALTPLAAQPEMQWLHKLFERAARSTIRQ